MGLALRSSPAILALAAASILACSSSDTPKYTTRIESVGSNTFALHLDSVTTMSDGSVKRALLTEAARATIDRGHIYLVVHEVTNEGSVVDVEQKTGTDPAPPQTPTSSEPSVRSEVSFSRQRSGTIRFTTFREIPAGDRVYDASQLLDRLKRGEMPE
ncbi:MAG TPA: hypothetical protein VGQ36_11270 [Thermoanaerobaculia bacterium]|jgi:hypothetical protein|nr:hypothetical protein [Thermoanaerobaculia bacterium]